MVMRSDGHKGETGAGRGHAGVKMVRRGVWQVYMTLSRKVWYLGTHPSRSAAIEVRRRAEILGPEHVAQEYKARRDADKAAGVKARRRKPEPVAAEPKPAGKPARRGPKRRKGTARYPVIAAEQGRAWLHKEQLFLGLGQGDVETRDGARRAVVDLWASWCADCGAYFVFNQMRPRDEDAAFKPVRRCAAHRQLGKRVNVQRQRETRPATEDVKAYLMDARIAAAMQETAWAVADTAKAREALRDGDTRQGETGQSRRDA